MKKTLLVLISSFMITGTMIAQDQAQDRDQTKIQQRDRIHQEDHLRLLDGKLYQYKQGVQSEVKEQVRLNNGMVINPDGSYQLKNQDRLQSVSYTHLRAHETDSYLVCRLLLEKKKKTNTQPTI